MHHNIAAIVEGDTEERFFKSILTRKCPVIYGIPNGMPGILPCIDFIKDKIATLPGSIEHIFVVLDREKREANHLEMSSQILQHLKGLHSASLYIGIPDRMIENWICNFEADIKKIDCDPYIGDGCHGKGHLEKILGYPPGPTETAALLKSIVASSLRDKSPSFQHLYSQVPSGTNYWFDR